jgi:quinol monooxygenase YgiN
MYSLISIWTIKQDSQPQAVAALKRLAKQVQEQEKETLVYLVHTPDMSQGSMPTPSNLQVLFFEIYKNKAAFLAHVNGPIFQGFVAKHGSLFLSTELKCADGGTVSQPFMMAEFLRREAGFIRPEAL